MTLEAHQSARNLGSEPLLPCSNLRLVSGFSETCTKNDLSFADSVNS